MGSVVTVEGRVAGHSIANQATEALAKRDVLLQVVFNLKGKLQRNMARLDYKNGQYPRR